MTSMPSDEKPWSFTALASGIVNMETFFSPLLSLVSRLYTTSKKWTPIPTGQDIMSINTSIYTLDSICCSSIYVGMKWHEDVWSNGDLQWSYSSGYFDVNWTDQPIETEMQIWAISIYQPQELRKMKYHQPQSVLYVAKWGAVSVAIPFAVFTSKSFLHRKNVHFGKLKLNYYIINNFK